MRRATAHPHASTLRTLLLGLEALLRALRHLLLDLRAVIRHLGLQLEHAEQLDVTLRLLALITCAQHDGIVKADTRHKATKAQGDAGKADAARSV